MECPACTARRLHIPRPETGRRQPPLGQPCIMLGERMSGESGSVHGKPRKKWATQEPAQRHKALSYTDMMPTKNRLLHFFLHGPRLWRQSRHTPCEHAYCLRQYGVFHFFSKKLKKEFDTHIEDAYKPASPTGWMTSRRQESSMNALSKDVPWDVSGCLI